MVTLALAHLTSAIAAYILIGLAFLAQAALPAVGARKHGRCKVLATHGMVTLAVPATAT